MKIFSAAQIKEIDQQTIQKQQLQPIDLMERAASRLFDVIHEKLQGTQVPIHIFCGLGNNGGDGLALARLLKKSNYQVETYIVNFSDNRSADFLTNYDRLKEISDHWPKQLKSSDDFPEISKQDLIIDAIFGIGLNRPPVQWVGKLIQYLNTLKCFIISVDVPSGVYIDTATPSDASVVYASVVLTFQFPKLIFYFPETGKYLQNFEVIDIELDREALLKTKGIAHLIGKREILIMYRPRLKFDHKGTYGHCLLAGGSYGKIGSVCLATEAALRAGAGLVTAFIPKCGYPVLQNKVPEAMVLTDNSDTVISDLGASHEFKTIGMGIGMGTRPETLDTFSTFLKQYEGKLVLDADAINLLAKNPKLHRELPEETILTPHPGELERLIGSWKDDFEKIEKTKRFSKQHHCIIVIKGAYTMVVYKDELYINTTGNPGMATAGSGDVLTGIITGLVAQGYDALIAAVFGVYLHGLAGDIGIQNLGYQALLASDIVSNIGAAYLSLFEKS